MAVQVLRSKSCAWYGITRTGSQWRVVELPTKRLVSDYLSRAKALERAQELDDEAEADGRFEHQA